VNLQIITEGIKL